MLRVHASCVEIDGQAILITGEAGSGKSSLCIELMSRGAALVSDDQTQLVCHQGRLYASSPANIAGLVEIYGVGILRTKNVVKESVPVAFEICLREEVERLQEDAVFAEYIGVSIPQLTQPLRDASVAAKIQFLAQVFQQDGNLRTVSIAKPAA